MKAAQIRQPCSLIMSRAPLLDKAMLLLLIIRALMVAKLMWELADKFLMKNCSHNLVFNKLSNMALLKSLISLLAKIATFPAVQAAAAQVVVAHHSQLARSRVFIRMWSTQIPTE